MNKNVPKYVKKKEKKVDDKKGKPDYMIVNNKNAPLLAKLLANKEAKKVRGFYNNGDKWIREIFKKIQKDGYISIQRRPIPICKARKDNTDNPDIGSLKEQITELQDKLDKIEG